MIYKLKLFLFLWIESMKMEVMSTHSAAPQHPTPPPIQGAYSDDAFHRDRIIVRTQNAFLHA